ncbi:YsnF/AvaK domain-containing protein [Ammoniphilus sp. 3BR4]|uniref:YsnF/AvaK domain-containing protein n=1 Tax=Ammoniphilus sp. 3BR4 TaxID=3158265 RepID=UPI003465A5AB
MGFFDLFTEENKNENQNELIKVNPAADTEFAEDGTIITSEESTVEDTDSRDEATVRLHEEKLDIHKERISTGEVVLHKDVIEEQKIVSVPVAHDQVVIERRTFEPELTNESITDEETFHIPVSAEKLEVGKYTVVTGEISVHKREIQDTQDVQDVVHKEVVNVETKGDIDIIDQV